MLANYLWLTLLVSIFCGILCLILIQHVATVQLRLIIASRVANTIMLWNLFRVGRSAHKRTSNLVIGPSQFLAHFLNRRHASLQIDWVRYAARWKSIGVFVNNWDQIFFKVSWLRNVGFVVGRDRFDLIFLQIFANILHNALKCVNFKLWNIVELQRLLSLSDCGGYFRRGNLFEDQFPFYTWFYSWIVRIPRSFRIKIMLFARKSRLLYLSNTCCDKWS